MAIALVAIALRFWALDIKPAHFDEGVNGWFADRITETGYYHYDPTNYHGPLHMYAVFVSQTLLGRNLWALRLPAVAVSTASVLALLLLTPYFGAFAVRFAALAMAVSPAFVFYGRYSIHESWMVLFLILTLRGVLGLWKTGAVRDLGFLAAGITGMILTKETYALHLACFLLAFPALWLWSRVVRPCPRDEAAPRSWTGAELAGICGAGLLVIVLFYSGFFLDFAGLGGLAKTFGAWFETGWGAGGHEKTAFEFAGLNFYWLALMARFEWPALAGVAACVQCMGPVGARVRYTAIYAVGALAAYSIIPYKTPWCIVSILWPFYLVAGWFLGRMRWPWGVPAAALLVLASLPASLDLNFRRFTDETHPYVYVQTYRDMDRFTEPLLEKARRDPRFFHASGKFFLESYYPLPWILGDFTAIGYYGETEIPETMHPAFALCSKKQAPRVEKALEGDYWRREFRLRSGVTDCVAFFRKEDFQGILEDEPAAGD